MSPARITIDNQEVVFSDGETILDAARKMNIHIPTLCHENGFEPFTSCMVCVVHEINSDRLIPSCSMTVSEGMQIETNNEKAREAQKDALDFLLSEHVGDCEAPCHRACPAHMDIPTMIRQIEEKRFEEAIFTVKKDIALPAVLGRICQKPCEKGCRRRLHDNPVSICFLKRFVADVDLALDSPYKPAKKNTSGKRVAIIGTGPTGLSAAYYLLQGGHDCHLYDKNPLPGGMLRYGVPDDILPKTVLDSEIERISELGAEFRMKHALGREMEFKELRDTYDALVLALGTVDPNLFEDEHLKLTNRGLTVNRKTFETTIPGVFAGGNALGESRMAIRATAHGKGVAVSVDQFLNGLEVTGAPQRFNSLMGKIGKEEVEEFLKETRAHNRIMPEGGIDSGYSEAEAVKESGRCFHCECRKQDSCRLRQYSEEYDADQRRYRFDQRRKFEKNIQHEHLIYEPGKCIKCGMCVRITEKEGEKLGLAFVNRGFEVRVETPFNEPLNRGLLKTAKKCIEACPTAALSWRKRPV